VIVLEFWDGEMEMIGEWGFWLREGGVVRG